MLADELIKRLRPLVGKKADEMWQSYLASDEEERKLIQHSLENLHSQLVDDYTRERIILAPPYKLEQLHGDYPAGIVHYAEQPLYPFAFLEKELVQHIGVFGRTGSGKSSFVKGLLLTHLHLNKPLLLFDWKGTYRDLAGHDIHFAEPGSEEYPFFFNPLDTAGIPPGQQKTYLRQVIELSIDSYLEDLKLLTVHGIESLLLRAVDELSGKRQQPTFQDIHEWVFRFEGRMREMDWKASALNLLYKLTKGPLGIVTQKPCDIERLAKQKLIFELGNIGNEKDKSFFIRTLFLRLYYHFQNQGGSGHLKLLVVIEEAHNVLLRKSSGSETIIELMLRQIREYGVGVCIVDQHPSLISYPALGTYCSVSFNLRLKQDRDAMASALLLRDREAEFLGKLPSRFAIVKIQDRFLTPFLIKAFEIKSGKPEFSAEGMTALRAHPYSVTPSAIADLEDEEAYLPGSHEHESYENAQEDSIETPKNQPSVKQAQEITGQKIYMKLKQQGAIPPLHPGEIRLNASRQVVRVPMYPTKVEEEAKKITAEEKVITDISVITGSLSEPRVSTIKTAESSPKQQEVITVISEGYEAITVIPAHSEVFGVIMQMSKGRGTPLLWEEVFLVHVCLYPLMGAVERYHQLGFNERRGNKHKASLISKKLATLEPVPTATGRLKIVVPTEKGFQWLKERNIRPNDSDKLGGFRHCYWKARLRDTFKRQGFPVKLEVGIGGKQAVDLVVSHAGRRVAVEIETGSNSYEKIIANIRKCLAHDFSKVFSLILDEEKAIGVKARLDSDERIVLLSNGQLCEQQVIGFFSIASRIKKKGGRGDSS